MEKTNRQYLDILDRIPVEKITRHPNILVAAGFWEPDRFRAAQICYRHMRKIDDLVDNRKATGVAISPDEKAVLSRKVIDWLELVKMAPRQRWTLSPLPKTIRHFVIPEWPFSDFASSMLYDLDHEGFATFTDFLAYSVGATVAPSSVFVHLCGIRRTTEGWEDPLFDVKEASTPCALFSYLVHIIRDFRKDQLENLIYFSDDLIEKHGLSRQDLRTIAERDHIPGGFRNLIGEYMELADRYRRETWEVIERISPLVEPRYQLSLLIIFNLYLQVFERIDAARGSFTAAELNPAPAEIHDRVRQTIEKFKSV